MSHDPDATEQLGEPEELEETDARIFRLAMAETSGGARPAASSSPRQLGPYQILDVLGQGGMGSVWRARDPAGREVALKVLHREGKATLARFLREGQITAALDHPGIVRVHAADTQDGVAYLVYELVEGARELGAVLEQADLTRSLELIRDAARALGHAHAHGVVHRDVKPANILVDDAGRVRVADFGIALEEGASRLTATGHIVGTPAFMAPEQLLPQGRRPGPPVDVWALGAILYIRLTGRPPFEADSLVELIARIQSGVPPELPEGDWPQGLNAILQRAFLCDPGARHPDARALAEDLDAVLAGRPPPHARPPAPWRRLSPRVLLLGLGLGASAVLTAVALSIAPEPATPMPTPAPPPATPRATSTPRPSASPPPDPFPSRYPGEGDGFRLMREEAERTKNPSAVWQVGERLRSGRDVEADPAEALRWFRRAAGEQAHLAARLGRKLCEGGDLPRDPVEGRRWLEVAARAGEIDAMIKLGEHFADPPALEWLREAVQRGSPDACYRLGTVLLAGEKLPRDPREAVRLLTIAAEADNRFALLDLGGLYREGEAVARDEKRARELLTRAAELELVPAMEELAELLEAGRGGPVDLEGARRWRERAARGRDGQ